MNTPKLLLLNHQYRAPDARARSIQEMIRAADANRTQRGDVRLGGGELVGGADGQLLG